MEMEARENIRSQDQMINVSEYLENAEGTDEPIEVLFVIAAMNEEISSEDESEDDNLTKPFFKIHFKITARRTWRLATKTYVTFRLPETVKPKQYEEQK